MGPIDIVVLAVQRNVRFCTGMKEQEADTATLGAAKNADSVGLEHFRHASYAVSSSVRKILA